MPALLSVWEQYWTVPVILLNFVILVDVDQLDKYTVDPNTSQIAWGQHGVHLGTTGPRWTPCWPHEPCYLGCFQPKRLYIFGHPPILTHWRTMALTVLPTDQWPVHPHIILATHYYCFKVITISPGVGISIEKKNLLWHRLTFIIATPSMIRWHLDIETTL